MADAFIYDHVRTPRGKGKADGALHEVTAIELGTQALRAIKGSPPSLLNLPSGCSFHPRCDFKSQVEGDACWTQLPEWRPTPGLLNREIRCHLADPVATLNNDEGAR